jgi:CO/xanthine dehydrogenase FAD-binding subunit
MTEIKQYIRAATVAEALSVLEGTSGSARLLAGGTDLLLKTRRDGGDSLTLVDISAVSELDGIEVIPEGIRIGAVTRLLDIEKSDALRGVFHVLAKGARLVGSPQIRNLATLGGNLCNAAPSADTAAPLLVLDAVAEVISPQGTRSVPLQDFFTGPGQTVLETTEMLQSIFIPNPTDGARSVYFKQSPRKAMDLAVVGVAVLAAIGEHRDVRISLTAVAPTPLRLTTVEERLNSAVVVDEALLEEVAAMAAVTARPISDVRGSAQYRREMVQQLVLRALKEVLSDQALGDG